MRTLSKLLVIWIGTALAACSVDAVTFKLPGVVIGGTITGLDGAGLVLTNNGGDDLVISGNGAFTFATPLERGTSYALAVKSQPSNPTQMCSLTNGSGIAGDEDVLDVQVSCQTRAFHVGGTVTGLAGSGLMLQNNGGEILSVDADGMFTFATPIPSGASYDVTVVMQPALPTQACRVTGGTGRVGGGDVTSVQVTCTTSTFTIGGTVTGLLGAGLVLQNNSGDDLAIGADGSFTFATPVASGATFGVTVLAQPAGPSQTCTVSGGTGTVGSGAVTSVAVNCTTNRYTIGGTISGLVGTVTLQNNGGDDLPVTSNGTFAFPTPVLSGSTYDVTVLTQPAGPSQTCTVTAGLGTVTNAAVTSVVVTCTTNSYHIGGTLSGLAPGDTITLRNNGGDDLVRSADGSFTFATAVPSGQPYAVTLVADPTLPISQSCTVTNGAGLVGGGDVTDVVVTCTTNSYRIGGTVAGLAPGNTITLRNNGGDDLVRSAAGSFTFPTLVASGQPYAVTVVANPTSPISQTCTVTNGAGTVGAGDVTSVVVTCTTNKFSIGGTLTGLAAGNTITLRNNGGDDLILSAAGSFTFATKVPSGQFYSVTVAARSGPISQTCNLIGPSGIVGNSDVTSIELACETDTFRIGGTVTGLASGNTITLRNNGGDDRVIAANGSFSFSAQVPSGQPYSVTVVANPTSPISQTCTVAAGSGTVTNADVTNVVVTCTTNKFSIGGTVTGLGTGNTITLRDNGGDDLVRSANGGFTFSTTAASGQSYAVTIVADPTSPISQTCMVTNGAGVVGNSNVTNVQVTCTTNTFTIGGTVTGLTGTGLVLQNNGGGDLPINANGTFTLATAVASGATYNVTIKTQPSGKPCFVSGGTGTVGSTNVTSVRVTCGFGTLVTINDSTRRLQRIDPSTLAVTDIGSLGVSYAFGDCAWNAADATLYVVDGRALKALYRVDLATGAATLIGVHGIVDMFSLAYNPITNKLYGIGGDGNLYTLSTTTGAATLIGPTGIGQNFVDGLTWDSARSRLVALTAGNPVFFALNVSTGAATLIQSGGAFINDLGMTHDPARDRYLVVDYNSKFIEFDPNNGFARTDRTLPSGSYSCLALVP